MTIHVTVDVSWQPEHEWAPSSVHVSGLLSGGARVDLVTHANLERVDTALRVRAVHEWLHDGLLVLDEATEVPVLVVPVAELSESVLGEALRRWLHHARVHAA